MSIHTFKVKPGEGAKIYLPAVSQKPFVPGQSYVVDSKDASKKALLAALQGDSTFSEEVSYTPEEQAKNEAEHAQDRLLAAKLKQDAARDAARSAQAAADAAIALAAREAEAADKEIKRIEAEMAHREAEAKAADESAAKAEAKAATKAAEKTGK